MKRLSFLFVILASCSLAPEYRRPVESMPPAWSNAVRSERSPDVNAAFATLGDETMHALIAEALGNNQDIAAALARVEQARASAAIVGSSLYPQATVSGTVDSTRNDPGRGSVDRDEGYRAQLDVSYAVDLWGKYRNAANSAELSTAATDLDRQTLALVIAGDTAAVYATLVSLNERIRIAEENLALIGNITKIVEARFQEGAASGLERAQQNATLASAEAVVSSFRLSRETSRTQLAILLGKAPQDFSLPLQEISGFALSSPSALSPADLLERRPDIRAAEASLQAAHFDVGAARASFLPDMVLGINLIAAASPISAPATLVQTLAASATQPIFRGGALSGELERSDARREELVAVYRQTVLIALQEVENALASVRVADERRVFTETAYRQAQEAFAIAGAQFAEGASDYQTLLNTETSLLQSADALLQVKQEEALSRIDLWRSMGGEGATRE